MDTPQVSTETLANAAQTASGFDPNGTAGVSAGMMLRMIFGDVANDPMAMLTSFDSGGTTLSTIFMYINLGLLTLGSMYLTYKTLAAVTQTAHDGDFIGKAFHSVWVPIRVMTGVLSLVPIAGGWNALQVVMLWVGVMGAGLGNITWQAVVTGWMDKGVVQQSVSGTTKKTNVAAVVRFGNSSMVADKVFEALLCDEAYRQSIVRSGASAAGYDNTDLSSTGFYDDKIAIFNSTGVECGSVTVAGQKLIKRDSQTREPQYFSKLGVGDTLAQQVARATKDITLGMINEMRQVAHDAVAEVVANQLAALDAAHNLDTPSPSFAKYLVREKQIGASYQAKVNEAVYSILNSAASQDKMSGIIKAAARDYGFVSAGSFYTAYANSSYAIKGAGDTDGMVDVTVNRDNHTDSTYTSTMNYYVAAQTKTSSAGAKPSDSNSEQGAFKLLSEHMGYDPGDNLIAKFIRHDETAPALVNIKNTADNVVVFASVGITAVGAIEGLMNKSLIGQAAGATPLGAAIEGAVTPWLEMTKLFLQVAFGFFLMCSIYLPLVPFIVFMGQVFEWLVSVILGVAAAPFLAFAHFDTDGEGLGQRTQYGYSFMLQSFMRPVMLVLGFVVASAMIEVSIYFLTVTYGFAVADAQVHSMTGLFSIFGYCALYMVLAVGLVNTSCSLMYLLPDAIFNFIGATPTGLPGRDTSRGAEQAALAGAGGARAGMFAQPKPRGAGKGKDKEPGDEQGAQQDSNQRSE